MLDVDFLEDVKKLAEYDLTEESPLDLMNDYVDFYESYDLDIENEKVKDAIENLYEVTTEVVRNKLKEVGIAIEGDLYENLTRKNFR